MSVVTEPSSVGAQGTTGFRTKPPCLKNMPMNTRMLAALLGVCVLAPGASASVDPPPLTAGGQLVCAPSKPADQPAWLARLRAWKASIDFDRSLYADPQRAWTRSGFIQALVIVQERTLFDPRKGRYTVDRYLDDVQQRYGGVDSVIIWHTYPNIGIDDRNQHDHLRDMPGGLPGLKKMVADFHKRGVRVLFPIMPWDRGTRIEEVPLADAIALDMAFVGADGLFGDTLNGVDRSFIEAADRNGLPIVLEPEQNLPEYPMIESNTMTWGQFWDDPPAPGISAYKWLEPNHMVHVTSRWAKNRVGDLHRAFLSGTGYESWENVWGIWNGITSRDADALRRISAIERQFSTVLASPGWEPYAPTQQPGVFASRFPGDGAALWMLVNRTDKPVTGTILTIPHANGEVYYDLWHGVAITPRTSGGTDTLCFEIPANGFGAVLSTMGAVPGGLKRFLARMAAQQPVPGTAKWEVLRQRMTPIAPTKPCASAPAGMVFVPGGAFDFNVSGVEIEGSDDFGVDIQYPWEAAPRMHHSRHMDIEPFYMDRTPVTNAQFKRFTDAARYKPRDSHNFLRHWVNGTFPAGWESKPVTWVSLEDVRAYARWAGKRLPHEWEWQYAAQGTDGRAYPWGNDPKSDPWPQADTGRTMLPPANVDAHPGGASPFGVLDLVGNVWQWTDEYSDDHTRAAVLRGGSHYRPRGSDWYFPQALRLDQHGKYLLMSPGKDRSGAIGFRCVADASSR